MVKSVSIIGAGIVGLATAFQLKKRKPDLKISIFEKESSHSEFHFEVDGSDVSGLLTAPPTGGWQTYQTSSYTGIALSAGPQVLRLVFDNGSTNINWFSLTLEAATGGGNTAPEITNPGTQNNTAGDSVSLNLIATDADNDTLLYSANGLPDGLVLDSGTGLINGSPTVAGTFSVTITVDDNNGGLDSEVFTWVIDADVPPPSGESLFIEAESYRLGGEGVGYHDTTLERIGGGDNGRIDAVDMEPTDDTSANNINIGFVAPGEWLAYDINLAEAGIYRIDVRHARNISGNSEFHFEVDGSDVSGLLTAPPTGGWQTYQTSSYTGIALSAGPQVLRLVFDNGSTNINWFSLTLEAATGGGNTPPVVSAIADQTNTEGDTVNLAVTASDADGDSLSFSAVGLPGGLSMDSASGQISGFASAVGNFSVTVSVNDGNSSSDSTSFNWTVNALSAPPPVETNPVSRSSSFTYNANGQVLTIDGPRTDVNDITTFEYDAQGNRSKTINALGQETLFTSYDASGRLLSMTDPNGIVTNLTYDPRGRLISRTVAGVTTAFDYDGVGQLIKITLPNNAELNYTYDGARRLTTIEDNLGNRISYTLDNMGNRTGESIFDDTSTLRRTQTRVFDELSRLIESISADGRSSTFAYDPNGNQTNSTDALSRSTQSSFDALDRLITTLDADNQTTQYGYDAQDNLTSVTDARGLTTNYSYDGFNNLQQLDSPDTGITDYTYDAAGNRITQTDARGITTRFIYDALNRLTEVRYPNAQFNINYTYDQGSNGIGRLTTLEDNSGTTTYQYDARGNLTQQAYSRNGVTHTTAYAYDNADNLTQITYPSGRIIAMNRDALGRIAQVSANSQLLADNVSYLPFGPMTSLTYGNGLNATNSFDQDYRLTSQGVGNVFAQTYGYDLVNNITTITDTLTPANDQLFSYDALDRLETAQGNYGNLSYAYDPVGNRTSETNPIGTNTYSYSNVSQQLNTIAGNTNSNLSYDANGNLITQDSTTYTYSDLNRLAQATANGQTTDYLYNGRGERTVKQGQTSTTLYHYDQSGLLLSETDEQGNTLRDYVYLNGQRLAILDDTGTYYIHSNHLDTPQVITDQNQAVVWQATYTPFGEANITTASIENNLRFPGQYFDEETNLHYNYFRDYNPAIGRYTTSDPIGLRGGMNTYSYVRGNPIVRIDPFGTVDWSGTAFGFTFLTFGYFEFNLTSECVNGKRGTARVLLAGPGLGFGGLDFSITISDLELTDPLADVDPSIFNDSSPVNGGFVSTFGVAGIGPGPAQQAGIAMAGQTQPLANGFSGYAVRLGNAGGTGSGPVSGLQFDISAFVGSSTVVQSSVEDCCN